MKTAFVTFDNTTGEITVSAYASDHPSWENNHIVIGELGRGYVNKHESCLNILSNVLFQLGVSVVRE